MADYTLTLDTGSYALTGLGVAAYTAVITQTLPAVTQAATGETDYFTLHDTVLASGSAIQNINELLIGTGVVGDSSSAVYSNTIQETALAGETLTPINVTPLSDTALVGNVLGPVLLTTQLTPRGAVAGESLSFSFSYTFTATAEASEVLTPLRSGSLQTTGYAQDSLITTLSATSLLTSTARADGYPEGSLGATLEAVFTATDSFTHYRSVTETLVNTATATDTQIAVLSTFDELLGSATADNSITFTGSVANNTLTSTALARGTPWARDFGALAWGLNTETAGLFTYDNFEFTSIVEYGGILYATSPEGVFALVGDNDVGRRIDAEVKTGFLDFGTEQTKRLSDLFMGYTGGQLEVEVETYDGPQEVYTYTLEERDANAPRNNRLKVGRGLSSRYWRFAIKNVDGADFQVYDVTAEVGTSRRRL